MIYTFREEAVIYTSIEADSEEAAWVMLDKSTLNIPDNVEIDLLQCELIETGKQNENDI